MAVKIPTSRRVVLDKQAFDRLMCSRGWGTLGQFAEAVNINPSTLTRMRAGKVEPTTRNAFAIAERLGVPVEVLFTRVPEEAST